MTTGALIWSSVRIDGVAPRLDAGGLNVGTGSIQSEEVYCSDIHSTGTFDNGTNSITTGSLSCTSHDTILEFLVTIIEFLVLAGQILQET